MDIREHSDAHHQVLNQLINIPDYLNKTHDEKFEILIELLRTGKTLDLAVLDAAGKRTFDTFVAISDLTQRFGSEAIETYIVSMTKGADDLIAAIVIAGQADLVNINEKKARIGFAPLLETVIELRAAGEILENYWLIQRIVN